MIADAWDSEAGPVTALTHAVIGAAGVATVALIPGHEPPLLLWGSGLLSVWLCVAGLAMYVALRRRPASESHSRSLWIPLRFSGSTGRFALRPRGDGRRVEVIAGEQIVAEVVATDMGDAIIVDAEAIPEDEVGYLGSAIGQAIEVAAAADEDHAVHKQGIAGPGVLVRQGQVR